MNVTDKQLQILKIVSTGNGKDPATGAFIPVDLDQLIDGLAYKPTKASIQFSIRALIKRGLIEKGATHEKRRGRQRVLILATPLGHNLVTFNTNPGFVGAAVAPMPELREAESSVSGGDPFGAAGSLEPQLPSSDEIIEL